MRPAHAISTIDFLTSLSETELDAFQDWKTARHAYDRQLDTYWDAIELKAAVYGGKSVPPKSRSMRTTT